MTTPTELFADVTKALAALTVDYETEEYSPDAAKWVADAMEALVEGTRGQISDQACNLICAADFIIRAALDEGGTVEMLDAATKTLSILTDESLI